MKHNTAAMCSGWAASSKDGCSTHAHKEFTFDPKPRKVCRNTDQAPPKVGDFSYMLSYCQATTREEHSFSPSRPATTKLQTNVLARAWVALRSRTITLLAVSETQQQCAEDS